MVRHTKFGMTATAIVAVTALAAATTPASAGAKFDFHFGVPIYGGFGYIDHGYSYPHYVVPRYQAAPDYYDEPVVYRNPCRRHLQRYDDTGRKKFLRRYHRCMEYYY